MKLIDTHTHLDFPEFDNSRDGVIERAREKDIAIINCFLDPGGIPKMQEYGGVFWTIGCCPYRFEDYSPQLHLIGEHMDKIIAIGEIGLDYHWVKEKDNRELEQLQFRRLISLAKEHEKPVLIHSRNAEKPCLEILEDEGVEKAIMHCFSGSRDEGMRALDNGYLISIPTNVIFSKQKQAFAKEFPLESLVLETDSPYLAPEPKAVNEPVNVIKSANKIAQIKGIEYEEVAKQTTKNARKFFGI
jgi:TatD DNase family protein